MNMVEYLFYIHLIDENEGHTVLLFDIRVTYMC